MVRLAVISGLVALCAIGAAQGLESLAAGRAAGAGQAQAVVLTPTPTPPPDAYGQASIAKSADGHFWADAVVDGQSVRFLVDTGATAVALTADDARRLGIQPEGLSYSYKVMTANGPARAALVRLGSIAVGRAEVSDVQAFVIDQGLETSLLGMSYLGRLSKFEATPDALVLKS
ncbi:MAG TPA: TIGR02281 family clan AA aspartic protease [Caulobacteraceae bacterium]|nr:TIGR02281 family clan AA aspartic protease [Caulobacteraceae bacterium]